MEMHATTVVWQGGGKILVHDKNQGVQNAKAYVCGVFGLGTDDVHAVTPFVGGGFGSGLRPQYQLFLAVMATLVLQRSVRVVMTRDQMFTHNYPRRHAPDCPPRCGPRRQTAVDRAQRGGRHLAVRGPPGGRRELGRHALRLRQRELELQAGQARHLHPRRHAGARCTNRHVRGRDGVGRAGLRYRARPGRAAAAQLRRER